MFLEILKPTLTVLAVQVAWVKEGYVITLVTHPEEIKTQKFASVREIVLKTKNSISDKAPFALYPSSV